MDEEYTDGYFPQSPVLRILRQVGAWVGLALVVVVIIALVGRYRTASAPASTESGSQETTAATAPDDSQDETVTIEEEPVGTEEPAPESIGIVVVLQEGLNFREQPSTGSSVLRRLKSGERLELLGTDEGWHHVRDSQGTEGYVSSASKYTMVE